MVEPSVGHRIIDAHAHLIDEPGYLDRLLMTMDACGIEKCCLSGIGPLFGCAGDDEVRAALQAHPDRVVGAVFVRPGADTSEKIRRAHGDGFRMVKVSILPSDVTSDHSIDVLLTLGSSTARWSASS